MGGNCSDRWPLEVPMQVHHGTTKDVEVWRPGTVPIYKIHVELFGWTLTLGTQINGILIKTPML